MTPASHLSSVDLTEGGVHVKRLALFAIAIVSLGLSAAAVAADGGATVETFPVSFVLSSATCSNLPAGTTVSGSGTEKSITTTRTDGSGATTIVNSTHGSGTATDQAGNTYVWDYSNEFRATNTSAEPDVFTGLMTDHFSLAGPGPAKLSNGFVATITTNFATSFSFDPINSRGDPIDFATGTAHCDPL
jgi:hypothetical protein